MSKHLVGATWEAKDEYGYKGRIWLESRTKFHNWVCEVWLWSLFYADGSFYKSDWRSNYRVVGKKYPYLM